jgi:hypothetical protein
LHELRLPVAEGVRTFHPAALAQLHMDQSNPRLRHGFVVTFFQIIDGRVPRHSQSLQPGADFRDGVIERVPAQIKINDLDVIAMVKLIQRTRFERGEKFVVAHISKILDEAFGLFIKHKSLLLRENNVAGGLGIETGRNGWIAWLVSRHGEFAILQLVNHARGFANIHGNRAVCYHSVKLLWRCLFVESIGGLIPFSRIRAVILEVCANKNKRGGILGYNSDFLSGPGPLQDERIWFRRFRASTEDDCGA